MPDDPSIKYRAFLSYSHSDQTWGKWLHRALETYKIDRDLVGRETAYGSVPKTLRPIFRDREDFSAGHLLSEQTTAALQASQFLIVICSPKAAQSRYVNEEVQRFLALGRAERVIPIIVGGEPGSSHSECFPPALRIKPEGGNSSDTESETLLAADARPQGDGKEVAKQKVIAALIGVGLDEIIRRGDRARRRHNRIRNGIIAALVVLAATSIGGFFRVRYELSRNEQLLDRTLERASALVRKSVTMAEQFAVPRAVSLTILEEAEGLFRDMAELGRDTPKMRQRKVGMLIEFGRDYATLGNTTAHTEKAREANRLIKELVDGDPGNAAFKRDLSVTYGELGDALAAQGDVGEALSNYQKSRAILSGLAKDDALRDWAQKRDPVVSHVRVGDILRAEGKLSAALEEYRASLTTAESLAKAYPDNTGTQSDLAISHERVGKILESQGKYDEALSEYRWGLAVFQRLTEINPNNVNWQRERSAQHIWIGDVLGWQRNFSGAIAEYRGSLAIREKLVQADPGNPTWESYLAQAHERIGYALSGQGNLDEALEAHERALSIRQRLLAMDDKKAQWERDVSVSHGAIGDVLHARGDLPGALFSYRQRLSIAMHLAAADPKNMSWQEDLAYTYRNVAAVLNAQGNLQDALKSYREGLAVDNRRLHAAPENIYVQRDVANDLNRTCWMAAILGELREALRDCNESLKLQPKDIHTLDSRGLVYLKLGRYVDAISDYDTVLLSGPKNASSLFGRGLAKLRSGDLTEGERDIAAAKSLRASIAKEFVEYGVR